MPIFDCDEKSIFFLETSTWYRLPGLPGKNGTDGIDGRHGLPGEDAYLFNFGGETGEHGLDGRK